MEYARRIATWKYSGVKLVLSDRFYFQPITRYSVPVIISAILQLLTPESRAQGKGTSHAHICFLSSILFLGHSLAYSGIPGRQSYAVGGSDPVMNHNITAVYFPASTIPTDAIGMRLATAQESKPLCKPNTLKSAYE